MNGIDPSRLLTEVVFWDAGHRSGEIFGHVEIDINGYTYSFEPGGHIGNAIPLGDPYQFVRSRRGARAYVLHISQDQETALISYLKGYEAMTGAYHGIWNNCTDAVRGGLEHIGVWVPWFSFTPGLLEKHMFFGKSFTRLGNPAPPPEEYWWLSKHSFIR